MTRKRITIGITGLLAAVSGAYMLLYSPASPAQTAPSTLPVVNTVAVQGYTLVRERKISRTVSDFTYRVSVRNTGPALIVVTGTASTAATDVTFVDGGVTLGDIASGTPATSTDTFTIRQDRTQPFQTSQLLWQFRAAPGEGIPPDPGPANDTTLSGIDSDNDGVRDDVERWIALTYPTSAKVRAGLSQVGVAYDRTLDGVSTREEAEGIAREVNRAIDCLQAAAEGQDLEVWYNGLKDIEAQYFSTRARWQAYRAYNALLAGRTGGASTPDEQKAAQCDVLLTSLPN